MENKRFLKIFASESEYNSQKDTVMGEPHVVYLEDTQTVVYKGIEGGNDEPSEPSEPEVDYSKEYFTIEFVEDGKFQLDYSLSGSGSTVVEYNYNNQGWMELTPNAEGAFSTKANDTVQLRAINDYWGSIQSSMFSSIEGKFNVKGNIMSLLYAEDFEGQTDLSGMNYVFEYLFYNCNNLVNAKDLVLPATTLAENCYSYMFAGCTSLTTAPELKATILANGCYSNMFNGCTSLTTTPELHATTLADYCYFSMFANTNVLPDCSNIDFTSESVVASGGLKGLFTSTKVTDSDLMQILPLNDEGKYCLPATILANGCYSNMFAGCTSLTTAPELPATTLAYSCYTNMFYGCSKLNYIKMLATNISASYCLNNWVYGVASNGTFVKNANMTSLSNGVNGIPSGWTVENA